MRTPWMKWLLLIVGLVAVVLIGWLAWEHDWITKWKQTAHPPAFFIGMVILPACGVPMTPLFVLAGATFGRRVGLIGSGIALVANLTLCYWIARSGLRPWLARLVRRFDYELPDFEKKYKGSVRFTLLVKGAPGVPQFMKNYALAVAGVPFSLYLVSSIVITGAYGALLIVLGESLFRHQSVRSILIAVGVVALALGIWWWRRRSAKRSAANQ